MTTFVYHVDFAPRDAVYIGRAVPRRKLAAGEFANQYRIKEYGREGAVAHLGA